MTPLSDTARPAADSGYVDAALLQAVAGMRPGWIVLRDGALDGGGQASQARVRYALLHPEIGVALLDILPGSTTRCAPDRLRRSLGAAGFQGRFGGYPPVAYLCMPSRTLSDLEWLLGREFGSLPPLALSGEDAWVGAARQVLAGRALRGFPGRAAAQGPRPPASPLDWERVEGRSPSRLNLGMHGLAVFWGSVALGLGCGVFVLQNLGPSSSEPAAAHATAGPGEPHAPRTASSARPAPAPASQRYMAWLPSPDSIPAPWSAERAPPMRPATEAAHMDTVVRDADGAGVARSPAGQTPSAPVPPVAPDNRGERSAASGSAAAAMDAAGPNTGAVDAASDFDPPEGAASAGGVADWSAPAAVFVTPPLVAQARIPEASSVQAEDTGGTGQDTADAVAAAAEEALHALARLWPQSDTAEALLDQGSTAPDATAGSSGNDVPAEPSASAAVAGAVEELAGQTRVPGQVTETDGPVEEARAAPPSGSVADPRAPPPVATLPDVSHPAAPGPGAPERAPGLDEDTPGAPAADAGATASSDRDGRAAATDASGEQMGAAAEAPAPAVSASPSVSTAAAEPPEATPPPRPDVDGATTAAPHAAPHDQPPPPSPSVAAPTHAPVPDTAPYGAEEVSLPAAVLVPTDAGPQNAERTERGRLHEDVQPGSEAAEAPRTSGAAAVPNVPPSAERLTDAEAAPAPDTVEAPLGPPDPPSATEGPAPPGASVAGPATAARVALAAPASARPPRTAVERASVRGRPRETPPSVARAAPESGAPSPGSRCRAIVIMAQLGEEVSRADRSLLRDGCGARR